MKQTSEERLAGTPGGGLDGGHTLPPQVPIRTGHNLQPVPSGIAIRATFLTPSRSTATSLRRM